MTQMSIAFALSLVLQSSQAYGQQPKFKNADVHVTQPGGRTQAIGRFRPGARFEANGFTMLDLIAKAYGIEDREWIVGGPAWLGTDKFDIMAEVPDDIRDTAMKPMLQALLADRFKLTTHNDKRPMAVYALVAGKRPLLKQSDGRAESRCSVKGGDMATMACQNTSLEQFARELYDYAYGYFDHPLFEKTGLNGKYDISLHWTPFYRFGGRSTEAESADLSVFRAIETELGLKIEKQREPVEVLVVDHVDRTPTPNAPGVVEALRSPALTQFEAAEVRRHKPETPFQFATRETEARILGLSLRNLIAEAYGVRDEELVAPKWVDTDTFDVIAKAPRRVPWENMQVMLQNLIQESFKLTFHYEDRPITAYGLTLGKGTPKLEKGSPNGLSDCRRTPEDGGRVTLTCTNTSMAQLAEKARELTDDYPRLRVADLTKLSGGFNLAVTWTPKPRTSAAPRITEPNPAGVVPEASIPTGELNFAEALDKQVGLKLQKQKLPMPVMIVDHVEPPPEQ